jgi:hypothetical protein
MTSTASGKALTNATIVGTVLQLAMVLAGHWVEVIRLRGFAIGGIAISALAGVIYARAARLPRGPSALNGAVAGGVCAIIGIALSFALGDVPALILVVGTASSTIGGAIGGALAGGMKHAAALLALLIAGAPIAGSQTPGATPESAKPIAALAWLVGGVWTADASKMGSGMKQIETRYHWSDNNAYLRFTTHFVTDKATLKNYDGSFFWNPEQSTLSMWYMDARNSITQGPVTAGGTTLVMTFRSTDFEGKPADLRVTLMRKDGDNYTWLLEETMPGAQWKPLATLDYRRLVGS